MMLDIKNYLPNDLLYLGDLFSMKHSIELRAPFYLMIYILLLFQYIQKLNQRMWEIKQF